MPSGRFRLAAVLVAMLIAVACGRPPDKELTEARAAIDAARAQGAEEYAPEELAAAQEALDRANEAVTQRDYQLALNHALDSRERAQTAESQTVELKAAARAEAERQMAAAATAITDARARVSGARAGNARVAAVRDAADVLDRALQEARAAADRSDWKAVTATLGPATSDLDAALGALPAATAGTPAGRRR